MAECLPASVIGPTSATVSGTEDNVPPTLHLRLVLATAPGGPYTAQVSPGVPGTDLPGQEITYTFLGLAPSTQYYYRTEVRDAANVVVDASTECTFTTTALLPPPFNPQPCDSGGGGGGDLPAVQAVQQFAMSDVDGNGELLGMATAVFEYDPDGNPVGAPVFVDPATGAPYVPSGTMRIPLGKNTETVCWTQTSTGGLVHTGTLYRDPYFPAPGWVLFDQHLTPVLSTEPGLTFLPCAAGVDPIATTGLCLGNGTPIALVVRRDSVSGTVTVDGWINLLTGAFAAGAPPVGTVACGTAMTISTSGILCDLDGGGDVIGLVIVQYEFNPDGSVAGTTLLNAVTGAPYVPAGTISVCPTGTEQPDADLVTLCDDNGPFLRDYRRDQTGTVVGVSNYTLAGAPYVTVGTVATCAATGTVIEAHHQDVTPGSPWTPPLGEIVTSVSFTVLEGTASVTDSDGTAITGIPTGVSATWNNGVELTLVPPSQIASVGGRVYVHFTVQG